MNLDRFKHLHVLVAVPHMGMWHADFARSLINMLTFCREKRVGEYKSTKVSLMSAQGSILTKLRLDMVENAIKQKADYLLFLDSDHAFPRVLLHRLLDWKKDCVAVNCVTKTIPSNPTARQEPTAEHPWGVPVFSDPEKEGLEAVWRVGTGVMLLRVKALEKLNWREAFNMFWNKERQTIQGEDWTLAETLKKGGVEIYVDHRLSRHVTHIGYFHYSHDYVGQVVQEEITSAEVERDTETGSLHTPGWREGEARSES